MLVLLAASFRGRIDFASHTLFSGGDRDLCLARFDRDGLLRYLDQAGGRDSDRLFALVVNASGDASLAGRYIKSASFGDPPRDVVGGGWRDAYVARYEANGALRWIVTPYSEGRDEATALLGLPDGDLIAGGCFSSTILFAPGRPEQTMLEAQGSSAASLARYKGDGTLAWAEAAGGPRGEAVFYDLARLPGGDILAVGAFKDAITLGAGQPGLMDLKPTGVTDALLARFTPAGRLVWARGDGGQLWDEADRVVVRPDGTCLVAGVAWGEAVFGLGQPRETVLPHDALSDVFLACYDAMGTVRWARHLGGSGDATPRALALLPDGSVLLAGDFDHTQTVPRGDGTFLTQEARGKSDFFLVRFDGDGNLLGAWQSGADGDERIDSLAVLRRTVYAVGDFSQDLAFGKEHLKARGKFDTFIAVFDADTLLQ